MKPVQSRFFTQRWLLNIAILALFGVSFQNTLVTNASKTEADDIVGVWQPENENYHVELYLQDGYYHGKIVWMEEPKDKIGRPKLDKLNPQRNLRTNQVLGLEIITDFEFNDLDNNWEEGMIYNPTSGETMKGTFQMMDDNTLELVAFVGFSLSEVTFKWTRVALAAKGKDE